MKSIPINPPMTEFLIEQRLYVGREAWKKDGTWLACGIDEAVARVGYDDKKFKAWVKAAAQR